MRTIDEIAVGFSTKELVSVINKVKNVTYIDNLRNRKQFVSLDSKIRGLLGESMAKRFLIDSGMKIIQTNIFDNGNSADTDIIIMNNNGRRFSIEVKTSLVPDKWNYLEEIIQNADIKIIKKEGSFIETKIDIYIQIYFNKKTTARDTFLTNIIGDANNFSAEELINIMKLDTLKGVIVGWIDKQSIINFLENETVKTWHYAKRDFWKSPLRYSLSPESFGKTINNYENKKPVSKKEEHTR
ncbi:MAG: hypothetical protein LBV51_03685 [Acholeplasmatales bacterium]|jgi:Holliday junction resolvase-like predicted endonuclease|nr:hypothetical protein [Acholeplasmatales bacterium]